MMTPQIFVGGPFHDTVRNIDTDVQRIECLNNNGENYLYLRTEHRHYLNGYAIMLGMDCEIQLFGAAIEVSIPEFNQIAKPDSAGIALFGAHKAIRALNALWQAAAKEGYTVLPGVRTTDLDAPAYGSKGIALKALGYKVSA